MNISLRNAGIGQPVKSGTDTGAQTVGAASDETVSSPGVASGNGSLAAAGPAGEEIQGKTDATLIRQALEQAGLLSDAVGEKAVMTLLDNMMPADRVSVRKLAAQIKAYPDADPDMLCLMNRNRIPVNLTSVKAMESFLNGETVFGEALDKFFDELEKSAELLNGSEPESLMEMKAGVHEPETAAPDTETVVPGMGADRAGSAGTAANKTAETVAFLNNLEGMTRDTEKGTEQGVTGKGIEQGAAESAGRDIVQGRIESPDDGIARDMSANIEKGTDPDVTGGLEKEVVQNVPEDLEDGTAQSTPKHSEGSQVSGNAVRLSRYEQNMVQLNASGNEEALQQYGGEGFINRHEYAASARNAGAKENAYAGRTPDDSMPDGADIEAAKSDLKEFLSGTFVNKQGVRLARHEFRLKPDEIDREAVSSLYKKLGELLGKTVKLTSGLQEYEGLRMAAREAARTMEFMNDASNLYPYIEIPLKLKDSEADAGLYVYRREHSSGRNGGATSALLHLDMPNLGMLDVKLKLDEKNLRLDFVSEESTAALLRNSIGELEQALKEKSYIVRSEFEVRREENVDARNGEYKSTEANDVFGKSGEVKSRERISRHTGFDRFA